MRIIYIVLLIFCFSVLASGQVIESELVFSAGVSNSFIYSKDFNSTSRLGMNCSFGFKNSILDDLDIITCFNFSTMGATIEGREFVDSSFSLSTEPVKVKFKYPYYMIDIIASYKLMEPWLSVQGGASVGIGAGPALNYNMANVYIGNSDNIEEDLSLYQVQGNIGFDYGVLFGLAAGNEDVQVCLQYTRFFKDICKGIDFTVQDYSAHNGLLELKVFIFADYINPHAYGR
ncbi:hypothetical protein SDC9_132731 [bioreactor metagenome]|uniref:Outer membrane protein beta-barrel domain-containing protein n=1 Tax=bioreactor metagenome TaxID=1076179 RepID=A0A645D800_9ZZZZ